MQSKHNTEEIIKFLLSKGSVGTEVQDYSKEPFFIKKTEVAKKKLERVLANKKLSAKK